MISGRWVVLPRVCSKRWRWRGVDGLFVQPAGDVEVLVPARDWKMVWNDHGSEKSTDYALWRGLPAPENRIDYVS